jgi:hypothetical protein
MELVFLIDSTFSKRDYTRFGFDIFLEHDISIELWDFRKLYKIYFDNNDFEADIDIVNELIKSKVFLSFNELNTITDLSSVFIFDMRVSDDSVYSANWFRTKGAVIVTFDQGLIPISVWKPRVLDYLVIIRNKFLKLGLRNFIRAIYRTISTQSSEIQYLDIKVCSGSVSKCSEREFEIRSHAFDFDIFLQEKNKPKSDKNYVLFLDCGTTNHPDYQKLNIPPYCSEEVYFPLIKSFFDKVEEITGLPVVIALHPRIKNTKSLHAKFGNREVISGKTAQLVKDAKLILNHDSTSINFAALWAIPMIIITTDQLEKSAYREMESQDQFLKTNRLNINKPYNDMDFFEIAKKPLSQYNHYIETFIKLNDSPSQHSAEILIQGLKKYVQ